MASQMNPDLQLRGLRRKLRRRTARLKELEELALDFKRYAQHEDRCGIYDKDDSPRRGVCSCGYDRIIERIENGN